MAEILSTISGVITEVNISVGQSITEDDEAFIIEAMKMENVIYGEDGIVQEILVKAGDSVEENQLLAVLK